MTLTRSVKTIRRCNQPPLDSEAPKIEGRHDGSHSANQNPQYWKKKITFRTPSLMAIAGTTYQLAGSGRHLKVFRGQKLPFLQSSNCTCVSVLRCKTLCRCHFTKCTTLVTPGHLWRYFPPQCSGITFEVTVLREDLCVPWTGKSVDSPTRIDETCLAKPATPDPINKTIWTHYPLFFAVPIKRCRAVTSDLTALLEFGLW